MVWLIVFVFRALLIFALPTVAIAQLVRPKNAKVLFLSSGIILAILVALTSFNHFDQPAVWGLNLLSARIALIVVVIINQNVIGAV